MAILREGHAPFVRVQPYYASHTRGVEQPGLRIHSNLVIFYSSEEEKEKKRKAESGIAD